MCGAGRRGGCCEAVNAAPHRRPENNRSASIAESAVTALELQTCWISFFNTNTQSDQIFSHGMSSISSYRTPGRALRPPWGFGPLLEPLPAALLAQPFSGVGVDSSLRRPIPIPSPCASDSSGPDPHQRVPVTARDCRNPPASFFAAHRSRETHALGVGLKHSTLILRRRPAPLPELLPAAPPRSFQPGKSGRARAPSLTLSSAATR